MHAVEADEAHYPVYRGTLKVNRVVALYAVSVRRLIALHSGFIRTVPHGSALAFGLPDPPDTPAAVKGVGMKRVFGDPW